MSVLKSLLKLHCKKEDKFWIIYDWCKRDLFVFLKKRITDIDWKRNWLKEIEKIHSELKEKWEKIERECKNYTHLKRLKGVKNA